MAAVDEDDMFWKIQLTGDGDAWSAIKPSFTSEVQWSDRQDRALTAGTEPIGTSLAKVLGDVQDVSIPMVANRFDASRSVDQREVLLLSVRLRQVNGEGVMSGVGGDVWCAALLLSAWLLTNPEVVRDQTVLELGSGLGLCGIVAGYLSESLGWLPPLVWCALSPSWLPFSSTNALSPHCAPGPKDYVDELLVNLHHNIEINRNPRVIAGEDSLPSPKRKTTEDRVSVCDHPPRRRLGAREKGGNEVSTAVEQASPGLCATPYPPPPPDDDTPVLESSWLKPERGRHPNLNSSKMCGSISSASAGTIGGSVPLQPLQRVSVRKVDWNAYADRDPAGDNFRRDKGSSKFWWDDEGPGAGGPGTPAASETVGPEPLHCDVAIGSALIYSPHHAYVADVLWHAFMGGGCRVAYIVQLSTRPGFDEFLHRLGSLGLQYRLQKVSAALPVALLNDLRRRTSVNVVGGPVTRTDACHDNHPRAIPEEGREFGEFVLCRVFHAPKT